MLDLMRVYSDLARYGVSKGAVATISVAMASPNEELKLGVSESYSLVITLDSISLHAENVRQSSSLLTDSDAQHRSTVF